MTKQQLIRLILDAAATGKIEDAEKAIDEYVEGLQDERGGIIDTIESYKNSYLYAY